MNRTRYRLPTALAMCLFVAACGGGDGGTDTEAAGAGSEQTAGASGAERPGISNTTDASQGAGGGAMAAGDGGVCGGDPESDIEDKDGDGRADCLGGYPTLPVVGEPGRTVDCGRTLPCTWVSADGAISIATTFADGLDVIRGPGPEAADLSTFVEIATNRDTTLRLIDDSAARSDDGTAYRHVSFYTLADGNQRLGAFDLDVIAGTAVPVRIRFGEETGPERGLLEDFVLSFVENGQRQEARFANLPVGRAPSVDSDCAGVLPCAWVSADGDFVVTVDEVGLDADGRLFVDFGVRTVLAGQTIGSANTAVATGADGSSFEAFQRRLGASALGSGVNATDGTPLPQGQRVDGRFTFAGTAPPGLERLGRLVFSLYRTPLRSPALTPQLRDLPVTR